MDDTFNVSAMGEDSQPPSAQSEGRSLDGEWKVVNRNKRLRVSSSEATPDNNIQIPQSKAIMLKSVGDRSLMSINPVTLVTEINSKIGQVKMVKKTKGGILIKCVSDKQLEAVSKFETLAGIPVKAMKHQNQTPKCQGVIHRVDKSIPDSDLLELLSTQKVTAARRFKKRINGKLEETPSVLLSFNSESTPESVSFLFEKYKVDKYVPEVLRCHKCQQFGHVQKYCKNTIKCVRCGGSHSFENCPKKEEPVCFRCKEKHSAAYKGCKMYKEAKSILSIKTNEKISYAQAARQFKNQASAPSKTAPATKENLNTTAEQPATQAKSQPIIINDDPTTSQPGASTHPEIETSAPKNKNQPKNKKTNSKIPQRVTPLQKNKSLSQSKDTISFDAKDFLSFMVFVVNNLDSTANRSDRIKLIVDAAKDCLNIQDVKAETLHDRFK